MYAIVLTDGKAIKLEADEVEWCEKTRTIRLMYNRRVVARINMDNVVGWIDMDYMAEKEDYEDTNEIEKTKEFYQKNSIWR